MLTLSIRAFERHDGVCVCDFSVRPLWPPRLPAVCCPALCASPLRHLRAPMWNGPPHRTICPRGLTMNSCAVGFWIVSACCSRRVCICATGRSRRIKKCSRPWCTAVHSSRSTRRSDRTRTSQDPPHRMVRTQSTHTTHISPSPALVANFSGWLTMIGMTHLLVWSRMTRAEQVDFGLYSVY